MTRDIKKDKRIRLIMRLLFTLFAFIIPVLVVSLRYKLFTEFTGRKISVIGFLILVSTIFRFRKRLMEWISSWEYSVLKYVLIGFSRIALFAMLVIVAHAARREATNIVFVLDWYLFFNVIAYLLILPIEEHYDFHVKRELRKTELREVIKE